MQSVIRNSTLEMVHPNPQPNAILPHPDPNPNPNLGELSQMAVREQVSPPLKVRVRVTVGIIRGCVPGIDQSSQCHALLVEAEDKARLLSESTGVWMRRLYRAAGHCEGTVSMRVPREYREGTVSVP